MKKGLTTATVRDILDSHAKGEISYSKMVQMLNESFYEGLEHEHFPCRATDIRNKYFEAFPNSNEFHIAYQMAFEWHEDFTQMKRTLDRLGEMLKHLEQGNKLGTHTMSVAYNELKNRIKEYSCANIKKPHLECSLGKDCYCNDI